MAVPTVLGDLSTTIASNSPAGGDAVGTTLDDYLRAHAGLLAQAYAASALKANNLSDLANAGTARTNLGLGTAATHATGDFVQVSNNLSDVTAATARTNLGLGAVATHALADFLQPSNNLSEITSVSSALTSLTIGVNVYTPTISNTVNLASSSVSTAFYLRVASFVLVAVTGVVAATAAGGTTTGFDISLPVASTLSAPEHAMGVAAGLSSYGYVLANVSTGKIGCTFAASTTSSQTINLVFAYRILP